MSTPKYQSGGFISVFQPQKWEDDRPTTVIFFQSGGSTTSYEQVWKTIGGLAHPSIHPSIHAPKKRARRRAVGEGARRTAAAASRSQAHQFRQALGGPWTGTEAISEVEDVEDLESI